MFRKSNKLRSFKSWALGVSPSSLLPALSPFFLWYDISIGVDWEEGEEWRERERMEAALSPLMVRQVQANAGESEEKMCLYMTADNSRKGLRYIYL